jgi:hypothetical protein
MHLPPGDPPRARRFHAMTYHAERRQVILFGGDGGAGDAIRSGLVELARTRPASPA